MAIESSHQCAVSKNGGAGGPVRPILRFAVKSWGKSEVKSNKAMCPAGGHNKLCDARNSAVVGLSAVFWHFSAGGPLTTSERGEKVGSRSGAAPESTYFSLEAPTKRPTSTYRFLEALEKLVSQFHFM